MHENWLVVHLCGFSPVCFLIVWSFISAFVMQENSQVVHRYGFSPECIFLWVFRLPNDVVLYSHWLQWCRLFLVCFLICTLRLFAWLHEKLHCGHWCGFFPVWMRMCLFNLLLWPNDLSHWRQLNFLIPLWVCLWRESLLLFANVFGHKSQDKTLAIFEFRLLSSPDLCANFRNHKKKSNITFPFANLANSKQHRTILDTRLSYEHIGSGPPKALFKVPLFALFWGNTLFLVLFLVL